MEISQEHLEVETNRGNGSLVASISSLDVDDDIV